jgi:hypothetical protein
LRVSKAVLRLSVRMNTQGAQIKRLKALSACKRAADIALQSVHGFSFSMSATGCSNL